MRSAATPTVDSVMHPDPIHAARIQTRYFVAMFLIVPVLLSSRTINLMSPTIFSI
jgi:hypothetical protein